MPVIDVFERLYELVSVEALLTQALQCRNRSGSFASAGPPKVAPIESSEAFLVAYQDTRGRLFAAVEQEIAWTASLWMAAYNVWEALHGDTPLSGDALRSQAAERLRRANA